MTSPHGNAVPKVTDGYFASGSIDDLAEASLFRYPVPVKDAAPGSRPAAG
jgi:hypothetical protein